MDTYEILQLDGEWWVIRRYENASTWRRVAGPFETEDAAYIEARLRAKYERERIASRTGV